MPIPDFQTIMLPLLNSLSDGADERTARIVSENAKTLKFDDFGFEEG